jgi:hypothetical protein
VQAVTVTVRGVSRVVDAYYVKRCAMCSTAASSAASSIAASSSAAVAVSRLEDELRQCKLKHAEYIASLKDEYECKLMQVKLTWNIAELLRSSNY